MLASNKVNRLLVGATLGIALAGCASTRPVAYSGISSSSSLAANPKDDSGRMPFSYSTPVEWRRYSAAIIDPVTIYRGADNQFDDISEQDKATLASYMQAQFTEKLRSRFTIASTPAPNTLRVKLTLTGAATSTPVIAPLMRFDIAGGIYNSVQAVRGREGAMTGSVFYAVEIFDAQTNRLLNAYVTKQYPNAYNVAAVIGSLSAAKTGIEKGADALVEQLR